MAAGVVDHRPLLVLGSLRALVLGVCGADRYGFRRRGAGFVCREDVWVGDRAHDVASFLRMEASLEDAVRCQNEVGRRACEGLKVEDCSVRLTDQPLRPEGRVNKNHTPQTPAVQVDRCTGKGLKGSGRRTGRARAPGRGVEAPRGTLFSRGVESLSLAALHFAWVRRTCTAGPQWPG